jgi:hypothetical protein
MTSPTTVTASGSTFCRSCARTPNSRLDGEWPRPPCSATLLFSGRRWWQAHPVGGCGARRLEQCPCFVYPTTGRGCRISSHIHTQSTRTWFPGVALLLPLLGHDPRRRVISACGARPLYQNPVIQHLRTINRTCT